MKVRFIMQIERGHDDGSVSRDPYTVDAECPEVFEALQRGGFGGDTVRFEMHRVIGANPILSAEPRTEGSGEGAT